MFSATSVAFALQYCSRLRRFEIFCGFLFQCGKDAVRGFTGDGEIYGCRVLINVDRAKRVVKPIKVS